MDKLSYYDYEAIHVAHEQKTLKINVEYFCSTLTCMHFSVHTCSELDLIL